MSGIKIQNLTFHYPGTDKAALKDMSLHIPKGEFVGIIGANNSGKSTFCCALSGIVPHLYQGRMQGTVKVDGADISTMAIGRIARNVGMVMQNPKNQLSGFHFTVFEEVAFGLENQGLDRDKIIDRVKHVLRVTGLEDLSERSPYQLSGGQQQRLVFAAAIALEPAVLVLDEPTTFLDPMGANDMFALLRRLNKQGMTIVIAEQRLELIAEYAGRVVALEDGKVVLDGTPQKILTSAVLKQINLEWTRYTKVAALAKAKGLWPEGSPLSISFCDTVQGMKNQ